MSEIQALRERFDGPAATDRSQWKRHHTEALFNEIERLNKQVFDAQQAVLTEGLRAQQMEKERDDWCEQAQRFRKRYAELRYPGMTGIVKPMGAESTDNQGEKP